MTFNPQRPGLQSARTFLLATIACALGTALYLAGGGTKSGSRGFDTRAVVSYIDGADWKVIDALA